MFGRGAWTGVLLGLVLGAVLGVFLLNSRGGQTLFSGRNHSGHGTDSIGAQAADTGWTANQAAVATQLNNDRTNAIVLATREVAPAVVSINVVQLSNERTPQIEMLERFRMIPRRNYTRRVQSMGSGVIVSSDGMVVTNNHVVKDALQVLVTLSDGRQYQAVILDTIERYDLAVLRIQAHDLPVARIAHSDSLQIGEWAIAIGSPYGYLLADTQPTVTVGVISALNRDIKSQDAVSAYLGMIQTDAAINPGNSGGPLVNTRGEVVGINTFIFSDGSGSVGIGFAVPASRVMAVVEEVRQYGHYREPRIGLDMRPITALDVMNYNLTDRVGAFVVAVTPDLAAWKAGLRRGDIIREIEGLRLDQEDAIYRFYYNARVGDRMTFRAERGGQLFDAVIVLEELAEPANR